MRRKREAAEREAVVMGGDAKGQRTGQNVVL